MAGGVNIKVKFDVDKAVKDSIGDLKKGLEGVSKSIDSVINSIVFLPSSNCYRL